ncbi:hypothetical protein Kpol_1028p95 [Vanderwaltozyma polyspora DSM 70294]|uniref:Superoxide dismutase [Cu-Zn] n=1 Tax=Vanderwaltozyma polyspora (strain ATCC 22028 / DSM 70294 / BCRC 21397 / CBS 2163 / NBRC 10782 / NRRL Y-8283 / UCD 57-17) TaxID=436907 RepID=A7TG62_VANPO|nr:uncharacterized protein Kpol_1028p95 [Vanderwaltozyma polyspora DSM 70294]EDO18819.1 hypothetical protein Kpol_1028p95 [Vanderwaltozyma polyspora DSM 70294]
MFLDSFLDINFNYYTILIVKPSYISIAMVKASVILSGTAGVSGIVHFEQISENDPTSISYEIKGNSPNSLRGFHIHEFGDLSNGCTSAGTHFNPFNKTHGDLLDINRHVGDMGNVQTDGSGLAKGDTADNQIKLIGTNSVIGRAVVIHAQEDDLGKGGNEESLKTGNAGARLACGVIGIST